MVRVTLTTWPEPLHWSQVLSSCPGSTVVPLQCSQVSSKLSVRSTSVPKTACSKLISTPASTSRPRACRCCCCWPPPPKKLLKMSPNPRSPKSKLTFWPCPPPKPPPNGLPPTP